MDRKKYAGTLRCTKNGRTFETSKGFSKSTGKPQIGCIIRLKRKLTLSMANILAWNFDLVEKDEWKEVVEISGAGPYLYNGVNRLTKEMLFTYILNHATWNMGADGVMEAVLAF